MKVVLFSGGIGSWAAAKRTEGDKVLLFTDTKTEDEDLYRFLGEAADNVGAELVTLADGRNVWEVFHDEGMIGNTRADICSRVLKRDLSRRWIDEHCEPGSTVVVGIDWTEVHRLDRMRPRWEPFKVSAPLTEPPYLSKSEMMEWARSEGLEPPRLYGLGFPHNNCGGFCVKQGQSAFRHLLRTMPDRYSHHEAQEAKFRQDTGKDVAILRDRRGGVTKPLTLAELREDDERQPMLDVGLDWGGCGCMVD